MKLIIYKYELYIVELVIKSNFYSIKTNISSLFS